MVLGWVEACKIDRPARCGARLRHKETVDDSHLSS